MEMKDKIQAELDSQEITQKELGKAVGINQVAINKIVKGKTKDPTKIVEMAWRLGVQPFWLKMDIGDKYTGMKIGPRKEVSAGNEYGIGIEPKIIKWVLKTLDIILEKDSGEDADELVSSFIRLYRAYKRDPSVENLKKETALLIK